MCYRIEPKPVREATKDEEDNRERERKREREREKERKHGQFTGESKVAGGKAGISMQRRKELSNIISIH
jgi:hypothetical protein